MEYRNRDNVMPLFWERIYISFFRNILLFAMVIPSYRKKMMVHILWGGCVLLSADCHIRR